MGRSAWSVVDSLQRALDDAKSGEGGDPVAKCLNAMSKTLLKLVLTDGFEFCAAFEASPIGAITLRTPPGTKLAIQKTCKVTNGLIYLTKLNTSVLGGGVMETDMQIAHRLIDTYREVILIL